MKKFRFTVERTRTGYSAYCQEGKRFIATVGGDMKELRANMLEALNLSFEEEGKLYTEANIKVVLDLPQFFEFYKVINAKALSERIGMNQSLLAQYIKGIKTPSEAQVNRILQGIRQLGKELSKIELVN
jgi:hypothetical protein